LTFHRSFHSQIEKLRQGRGSQRSGTHPRELRQGRLWSSGIMRACRLLVVRARRVRVILRCPTRPTSFGASRSEGQRTCTSTETGSECSSESAVQRGVEATVQGRTWNLKPEKGRETRAGMPPLARTGPQAHPASAHTSHVVWRGNSTVKARCAHCPDCQWLLRLHVTLPRTPTFLFPTVCLACGPGLRPAPAPATL